MASSRTKVNASVAMCIPEGATLLDIVLYCESRFWAALNSIQIAKLAKKLWIEDGIFKELVSLIHLEFVTTLPE